MDFTRFCTGSNGGRRKKETGASLNVCPVLFKDAFGIAMEMASISRDSLSLSPGRLFDLAVSGAACLHVPRLERDERERKRINRKTKSNK